MFLKFGFTTEKIPLIESSLKVRFDINLIPLPKKLFSLIPAPIELPEVPTPAEAVISPVGFSSTVISIIFNSSLDPVFTSLLTLLKKFKFLILFIVLLIKISLYGSPSSNSN